MAHRPLCICLALLSPKSQGPKPLTGLCVYFCSGNRPGNRASFFHDFLALMLTGQGQGHAPRGSRGGSLPVSSSF